MQPVSLKAADKQKISVWSMKTHEYQTLTQALTLHCQNIKAYITHLQGVRVL